ncbi:HD family hydrolase [Xenorhabdus nematophila]|uniref:HD family hydrolase n=1 Tax=Xenorhabdus nematophila TaxID=628 RepID=UPI0032B6FCCA
MSYSYIATRTGRHLNYSHVTSADIDIQDIAQGLANECRFNGQIQNFYSVAQHSVYVSQLVPPEYALEGLLHDATEAYCKDVPSPLKCLLPTYQIIERNIDIAVRRKFGLPIGLSQAVKHADLVMLATERRDLDVDVAGKPWPILTGITASDDIAIMPLTPPQALSAFMNRYHELTEAL